MADRVVVGNYASEVEAGIDRNRLQSVGIESVIVKDDCGGMRPHLQYTLGVKLEVRQEEEEKAREVLGAADESVTPAWTCACGETIEEGYDACWKCGAARPA